MRMRHRVLSNLNLNFFAKMFFIRGGGNVNGKREKRKKGEKSKDGRKEKLKKGRKEKGKKDLGSGRI